MSKNKGKDGEMQVAKLLANVSQTDDNVDFTRQTITNCPDQGADFIIKHDKNLLPEFAKITDSPIKNDNLRNVSQRKNYETRIDVKTTDKKLQKDIVDKFVQDINNFPNCDGHLLMGGEGLTKQAKKNFDTAQDNQSKKGKNIMYISNKGIRKLEEHYESQNKIKTIDDIKKK